MYVKQLASVESLWILSFTVSALNAKTTSLPIEGFGAQMRLFQIIFSGIVHQSGRVVCRFSMRDLVENMRWSCNHRQCTFFNNTHVFLSNSRHDLLYGIIIIEVTYGMHDYCICMHDDLSNQHSICDRLLSITVSWAAGDHELVECHESRVCKAMQLPWPCHRRLRATLCIHATQRRTSNRVQISIRRSPTCSCVIQTYMRT